MLSEKGELKRSQGVKGRIIPTLRLAQEAQYYRDDFFNEQQSKTDLANNLRRDVKADNAMKEAFQGRDKQFRVLEIFKTLDQLEIPEDRDEYKNKQAALLGRQVLKIYQDLKNRTDDTTKQEIEQRQNFQPWKKIIDENIFCDDMVKDIDDSSIQQAIGELVLASYKRFIRDYSLFRELGRDSVKYNRYKKIEQELEELDRRAKERQEKEEATQDWERHIQLVQEKQELLDKGSEAAYWRTTDDGIGKKVGEPLSSETSAVIMQNTPKTTGTLEFTKPDRPDWSSRKIRNYSEAKVGDVMPFTLDNGKQITIKIKRIQEGEWIVENLDDNQEYTFTLPKQTPSLLEKVSQKARNVLDSIRTRENATVSLPAKKQSFLQGLSSKARRGIALAIAGALSLIASDRPIEKSHDLGSSSAVSASTLENGEDSKGVELEKNENGNQGEDRVYKPKKGQGMIAFIAQHNGGNIREATRAANRMAEKRRTDIQNLVLGVGDEIRIENDGDLIMKSGGYTFNIDGTPYRPDEYQPPEKIEKLVASVPPPLNSGEMSFSTIDDLPKMDGGPAEMGSVYEVKPKARTDDESELTTNVEKKMKKPDTISGAAETDTIPDVFGVPANEEYRGLALEPNITNEKELETRIINGVIAYLRHNTTESFFVDYNSFLNNIDYIAGLDSRAIKGLAVAIKNDYQAGKIIGLVDEKSIDQKMQEINRNTGLESSTLQVDRLQLLQIEKYLEFAKIADYMIDSDQWYEYTLTMADEQKQTSFRQAVNYIYSELEQQPIGMINESDVQNALQSYFDRLGSKHRAANN